MEPKSLGVYPIEKNVVHLADDSYVDSPGTPYLSRQTVGRWDLSLK